MLYILLFNLIALYYSPTNETKNKPSKVSPESFAKRLDSQ